MQRLALVLVVGCGRVGFDADEMSSARADAAAIDGTSDGTSDADALGVTCVHQTCDLLPQCGCDEGSKCEVELDGTRRCTAAGTSVHGEVCASTTTCEPATTCVRMSDWPESRCVHFCDDHVDCDALGNGSVCAIGASQGGMVLFRACTIACDVIAQTGCPAENQCSVYTSGNIAGTNCTAIGTVALNQTCSVHFDCSPGMVCAGTCKTACIVGDSTPCGGGTTCRGTGAFSDGVEFGYCN